MLPKCWYIHLFLLLSAAMSHTILLVQPGPRPETRTYSDYESVNECMEGVCKIYEEHLKRRNPNTPTITYDISQLFDFLDQVSLLCKQFCICNRFDVATIERILMSFTLFSWRIWVAWSIKNQQTLTHPTIKNGSKRRSTFCCDKRLGVLTKVHQPLIELTSKANIKPNIQGIYF